MPTIYIYAIVAAVIASATGAAIAYTYHKGHASGKAEVVAEVTKRDNVQLAKVATEVQRLQEAARADEQRHAEELAAISADYEKDLQNANATKTADVAAARSGRLVLRVPAKCPPADRGSEGSQVAAAPGGRDGGVGSELPREVVEALFTMADDADQVVRQLAACQRVVHADRFGTY